MNIKRLAVFGDSWVYGDELIDPELRPQIGDECCHHTNTPYRLKKSFSGLIADHFNIDYENYGHPGASLQSTMWTFLWWLRQDIRHEDYLVLVGLTAADRQSWYNPEHQQMGDDPDWNKYIHSTWVNFGSSVIPQEWQKFGKDYLTLSHSDELSELNYEQAVYFFDGISKSRNLKLGQFNLFQQPKVLSADTLWWPDRNFRDDLAIRPDRKEIHAPMDHPNELGHEIVSKQLLSKINDVILT